MRLAVLICTGISSSCLAMTGTNHAYAQSPTVKAFAYIGGFALSTYAGMRAADAARKLAAQGAPVSPQRPIQGRVYQLGPEWRAVTSAGYCVSYYPGVCSPCDWDGSSFCGGHLGESVIQVAQ